MWKGRVVRVSDGSPESGMSKSPGENRDWCESESNLSSPGLLKGNPAEGILGVGEIFTTVCWRRG